MPRDNICKIKALTEGSECCCAGARQAQKQMAGQCKSSVIRMWDLRSNQIVDQCKVLRVRIGPVQTQFPKMTYQRGVRRGHHRSSTGFGCLVL